MAVKATYIVTKAGRKAGEYHLTSHYAAAVKAAHKLGAGTVSIRKAHQKKKHVYKTTTKKARGTLVTRYDPATGMEKTFRVGTVKGSAKLLRREA